jgi:hypothetical protein
LQTQQWNADMDWRQFLCEEIDRKIALIRLVLPENMSIVANDEATASDLWAYVIQEHRDQAARIDKVLAEGEVP